MCASGARGVAAGAPPEPKLSSPSFLPGVFTVGPGGHQKAAGSAACNQEAPIYLVLEPQGSERRAAERRGFVVLVSSNSTCTARSWSRGLGPPPAALAPAPAAPNGPRLTLGSREEARRGRRPGHCAAGAAGSCGCARPAPLPRLLGRAPCRDPRRTELRRTAANAGPRGSDAPRWQLSGSKEGVPLFATLGKAPLQPSPAPTHPHTPRRHRVAHLSPKSC